MTAAERRIVDKYIAARAADLGLRDWRFILSAEPSRLGALASIQCTYGRKVAAIWLNQNFRQQEPAEQVRIIIHELLHAHLEPMGRVIQDEVQECVAPHVYAMLREAHNRAHEYAVDGIAAAIAAHFPLIKWDSKKPKGKVRR